ncbi:MAG: hypothetical protein V7849_05345 [Candidatus Competibacter sp.]
MWSGSQRGRQGLEAHADHPQKKTFKDKERDLEKRLAYWRTLRQILAERGSADGVSIDESGFEPVP